MSLITTFTLFYFVGCLDDTHNLLVFADIKIKRVFFFFFLEYIYIFFFFGLLDKTHGLLVGADVTLICVFFFFFGGSLAF